MPDNIESITILPKLNRPGEKDHIFQLLWVLDMATDSDRCTISLLFKNIKSGFIIVDTIPPELLAYCTVGSFFQAGKKLPLPPNGRPFKFIVNSATENRIVQTNVAFSDAEYDLSLNGNDVFSRVSKSQYCFVQQVDNIKIVIPCFVLAATYYFKSTSLRNAIMSRKLESLYLSCDLDPNVVGHAAIQLKPEGNLGDAKSIARFKLSHFADQRLNMCVNHLYANKNSPYKRLKLDFPVEQRISIEARGQLIENAKMGKTFIAFQVLREDSGFPFDSLDVIYEKEEAISGEPSKFPVTKTKHSGEKTDKLPSDGLVRHLLSISEKAKNPNEDKVKELIIAIPKTPTEKTSQTMHDERLSDLSFQPGSQEDSDVSRGVVQETEEEEKRVKQAISLDEFKKIVDPLNNLSFNRSVGKEIISEKVAQYEFNGCFVKQANTKKLTLKESYDKSSSNPRRCAHVFFACQEINVCLVEIDQEKLPGNGCSTFVLISKSAISKEIADSVVAGFVEGKTIPERKEILATRNVVLKTKNHPEKLNEDALEAWRAALLRKVLE